MKKLMISLLVGLFGHGLALGVQFVDGDFAAYSIDDNSAVIWQYNGHDKNVVIPDSLTYTYVTYEYDEEGNYRAQPHSQDFKVVEITAFYDNQSIETIEIPDGVTKIQNVAFYNCSNLVRVTMSDKVRSIGDSAFAYCAKLKDIELSASLEEIGSSAFLKSGVEEIRMPGCVRKVGDYVFEHCEELQSVILEDGFDAMGFGMFSGCKKLQKVTFPSSLTTISQSAFSSCLALPACELPQNVGRIGSWAFGDCRSIAKLTIPVSVTEIGDHAFAYCSSLATINVSTANRHYKSSSNCLVTKDGKVLVRAPTSVSVIVPDGVEAIADGAFSGCRELKNVTLPASVETLGVEAFSNCDALETITMPPRLKKIGVDAFRFCMIHPLVLSASVSSIGCDAFLGWYRGEIIFEGKPPKFEDTEDIIYATYPSHTLGGFECVGYYRREFAEQWEAALDDNGYWHGLRMLQRDKGYLMKYEFRPTPDTDSLLGPSRSDFHLERASGRLCKAEKDGGWREVASFKSGEPVDIIWGDGTYRVFFGYDNSEAFGEPVWVPFIECEDLTVPMAEDVSRIRYFYDRENYPLEENGQPVKLMVYFNPGKNASCSPQVVELPESARGDYPFVLESGDIPTPNRPTEVDGDIVRTYRFRGWYDGDRLVEGGTAFVRGRKFMWDGEVRDGVLLVAKWDVTEIDARMRPGTGKWRWEDSTVEWTFDHSFENLMSVSSVTPKPTGDLQIPEEMSGERVASIGRYAFSNCQGLTSVSIPEGVQSIGVQAFSGCYDLTQITFPSTLRTIEPYAFGWCLGLEYVEIPVGVTTIEEGAFTTCGYLETVVLPEGLTTISSNVFNSCCLLRTVTIPSTVTKIEPTAFSACSNLGRVYVTPGDEERVSRLLSESGVDVSGIEFVGKTPEGLLIDHGLLIGFEGMMQPGEAVVVPDCVTGMVDSVFAGMPMGSVVIPSSVKRISDYAFASCWQLNVVTLAPSIETIGVGAFSFCSGLGSIVLPAALKEIGHFAFEGCEALREILVMGGNPRYYTVGGILYDRQSESLVCCPGGFEGELQVPEGVKEIGYAACELCTKLKSVKLPSSVEKLGFGAFFSCTNLETLVFEGNAPSVEERALEGVPPNCTAIVRKGTSGWNVPIPGLWNGIRIVHADDGDLERLVDESGVHVDVTEGEVAPYAAAAAVYDGYLYDANGIVKGTVQVKVAKMKNGEAKVTATVQLADGSKKLSFKNGVADAAGNVTGMSAGGHALSISLGVNGMGGSMDGNSVDGARNLFSSKSKEEKAAADAIANDCIGTYNIVGEDGVLTVTVAKKGKAKVSGTWKGAKVSVSSQLLIGESACVVPVVFAKKGVSLAFNLNIFGANDVTVTGLSVNAVGKPGTLAGGAAFRMGDGAPRLAAALADKGTLQTAYLPDCAVAQSGTKWVVAGGAKAGKLALLKGTSDIDPVKSKFTDNMSGLKLTYKAKDGSFKGSFKAYNLENGKLKAYTVNVTGVLVGDTGYGTATVKKPAVSFPITVE